MLTTPHFLDHKQNLVSRQPFWALLGLASCDISGHTVPWAIRFDTTSIRICRSLTHLRSFWQHYSFCWDEKEYFAASLYPFLRKCRKRSQSFNSSKLFFLFFFWYTFLPIGILVASCTCQSHKRFGTLLKGSFFLVITKSLFAEISLNKAHSSLTSPYCLFYSYLLQVFRVYGVLPTALQQALCSVVVGRGGLSSVLLNTTKA